MQMTTESPQSVAGILLVGLTTRTDCGMMKSSSGGTRTMMRRLRLWICPCCKRCWTRFKNECRGPRCHRCGENTRAGRVWPKQRKCCHERATAKYDKWRKSKWSAPRMQSGMKLVVTAELRSTWKQVRRAKTRPSFERRANAFVELLMDHAADTIGDNGEPVRWKRELRLSPDKDRVIESKSAGGWIVKAPVKLVDSVGYQTFGIFTHGIGCKSPGIKISLSKELHPTITEMRATLVHEMLHALDRQAGIGDGSHDHLWRKRLRRMLELFPPTEYRTAPTKADIERWL